MTVEVAQFITDLEPNYPEALSNVNKGDDHLRLIKAVLKAQFPNFTAAAVQASVVELNHIVGLTGIPEQVSNKGVANGYAPLDGGSLIPLVHMSGRAAILSQSDTFTGRPKFNGGTSGSSSPFTVDSNQVVANLNADLLDGQQASYFAPINSPAFTGNPTATTQTPGDDSTKLATTAFVEAALGTFTALQAATKGRWKDEKTGFKIQWGTESSVPGDDTRAVTFYENFATVCYGVFVNAKYTGSLSGAAIGVGSYGFNVSGFTIVNDAGTADINWVAIGV
jgi:hypothetical protein